MIIDNLATVPGRAKIEHLLDHPRVTFVEGSITDLDLLMEAFPGTAGIFGGHPLHAPVGEGPPRLERGERDRHRQGARRGERLRGAGRGCGILLLGLRRHPRLRGHPHPPLDADHIVVVSCLSDDDLPKRPLLGYGIEESCFPGQ